MMAMLPAPVPPQTVVAPVAPAPPTTTPGVDITLGPINIRIGL